MWSNFKEYITKNIKTHARLTLILMGILLLLIVSSSIVNADTNLAFGECIDILNATNETVRVCAPVFPVINRTINLTYPESYIDSPYLLTVNTLSNNCTFIENITVLNVTNTTYVYNVTNVTTSSCLLRNQTISLNYSSIFYDSQTNTTYTAPPYPPGSCTGLSLIESIIGYNETRTWENASRITIHGPNDTPTCTDQIYCSNVSTSKSISYGEYFKVNQPGCFVEVFGPPAASCPACACPTCPTCPQLPAIQCPNNTIVREINVDTCLRPSPSFNCTELITIGGLVYCKDSLDMWCAYQINNSQAGLQSSLSDCQGNIVKKDGEIKDKQNALDYMNSHEDILLIGLVMVLLCLVGVTIFLFYKKIGRGGAPVAENRSPFPSLPSYVPPEMKAVESRNEAKVEKKQKLIPSKTNGDDTNG